MSTRDDDGRPDHAADHARRRCAPWPTRPGVDDRAPVVTEPFSEWVISGATSPAGGRAGRRRARRSPTTSGRSSSASCGCSTAAHSLLAYAGLGARARRRSPRRSPTTTCRGWLRAVVVGGVGAPEPARRGRRRLPRRAARALRQPADAPPARADRRRRFAEAAGPYPARAACRARRRPDPARRRPGAGGMGLPSAGRRRPGRRRARRRGGPARRGPPDRGDPARARRPRPGHRRRRRCAGGGRCLRRRTSSASDGGRQAAGRDRRRARHRHDRGQGRRVRARATVAAGGDPRVPAAPAAAGLAGPGSRDDPGATAAPRWPSASPPRMAPTWSRSR